MIRILLVALVLLAGCVTDSDFRIEVTGTPGLEFSGHYGLATADGQYTSKSVDGTVPATYTMRGHIVSGLFQKTTEDGTLRVEIFKNGRSVAGEETMAAYGIVSVGSD